MSKQHPSRLRFNFGFLLEATIGTSRLIELDYPQIQVAEDVRLIPLQGSFTATRISEGVYLSGTLRSAIRTECVRCLEEAVVPLAIKLDDLFYYPPHTAPPGESVVGENGFVDLAPLVRELALLDMPGHPLCKPDCQGLCMECGHNLNEGDCGCREETIDPRFEILKKFFDA
jgi:uncharacterized protein